MRHSALTSAPARHPERLDALRVLRDRRYPVASVWAVDVDAILWVDQAAHGHTAWLHRDADGKLQVTDQLGFLIEPT